MKCLDAPSRIRSSAMGSSNELSYGEVHDAQSLDDELIAAFGYGTS
jgi:hypothetical protein